MQTKIFLLLASFMVAVGFTGCFNNNADPFVSSVEDVERFRLTGNVFKFSTPVATQISHRLEANDKLVGYLSSEVLDLEPFENKEVRLEGYWAKEKMREFFMVEKVKLASTTLGNQDFDLDYKLFKTDSLGFLYPKHWQYNLAPNNTAYFLDSNDPTRRVFLTLEIEKLTAEDKLQDPNLLISNLAALKELSTDEVGRERENLTLFSNLFDKKYTFVFTNSARNVERKQQFLDVVDSLVEGDVAIEKLHKLQLAEAAETEASKIEPVKTVVEAVAPKKVEPIKEKKKESVTATAVEVPASDFNNLVNDKAFDYKSAYYRFSMQVPYGFWFRNYGQSDSALAEIGFADESIEGRAVIDFWLEILSRNKPLTASKTLENGSDIEIIFPRNDKTIFKFRGPKEHYDAMKSIEASIKTY